MARYEERTADKNGLIRVDNAMYRVPDGFARRDVQLVVVGDTITVRCGGQSVILDKARDIITAKDGTWSNPLSKEENFKKKIKELKKTGTGTECRIRNVREIPARTMPHSGRELRPWEN